MRTAPIVVLAFAASLAGVTASLAVDDPPSRQGVAAAGCRQVAEPATKPAPASADGTSPGNAGSTGWSGGLGGSNIGTSQNGATPNSKSGQPVTAKGLDPIARGAAATAC